ncbi:hypothetical protein EVAR_37383_1 [Eumeta japonica]|uniref:Uncharacterized protein n=1 Tax=Eumeta variegata TaxID=151549 RepID=A0A4C1ZU73_EUMVA|nr:hypothetical protein EVAR_37383_1 [Eumeta japonica]
MVTAAHGHYHPRRSHRCVVGLLSGNRISNGGVLVDGRVRGSGPLEFSLTGRNGTAEAAHFSSVFCECVNSPVELAYFCAAANFPEALDSLTNIAPLFPPTAIFLPSVCRWNEKANSRNGIRASSVRKQRYRGYRESGARQDASRGPEPRVVTGARRYAIWSGRRAVSPDSRPPECFDKTEIFSRCRRREPSAPGVYASAAQGCYVLGDR